MKKFTVVLKTTSLVILSAKQKASKKKNAAFK